MIRINLDRITKNQLVDWCIDHAKELGVEVTIDNDTKGFCYAYRCDRSITLNAKRFKKKSLAFAFFHEMGHIHIWDNNLFKTHDNKYSLRVEQWCDTYGEKQALRHFTNPNCYKPYHTQIGINYIRDINKLGDIQAKINLFEAHRLKNLAKRKTK